MPGTVLGTKDKSVHYKANMTDPGMHNVNNCGIKNKLKAVTSDHKLFLPTSDYVLLPSATSEPKRNKKTDPEMHTINNSENKNKLKTVKSDHKLLQPTSDSVLKPSATS
jgi:hypothetical protein